MRACARRHERNLVTEAHEQVPDAQLIAAVRAGDAAAFGVLYQRHLVAAKRAAACLASTPAEREDLVAEAFTRVLRMLREGRGPDEEFRPYLLVTLRNTAINALSRGAPVSLYAEVPDVTPSGSAADPVIDRWLASVAAAAFASLPERWQAVLWHTEVEDEPPAKLAPLLGMRPNGVAALAYRAREGLRQAYLRKQLLPEQPRRECRLTVDKLAGYVRHGVSLPLSRKIGKHLKVCGDCRARAAAVSRANSELGALLGPIMLGAPLAVASEAATTTASGMLALKTTLVQVAAAFAVTATAASVTSSAVMSPGFDDRQPVAAVRAPVPVPARTAVPSSVPAPPATASADRSGQVTEPAAEPAADSAAEPVAAPRPGSPSVSKSVSKSVSNSGSKSVSRAEWKTGQKATGKAAKADAGARPRAPSAVPAAETASDRAAPEGQRKPEKAEKSRGESVQDGRAAPTRSARARR
jgi:RNA polymerase sigma factor (sigma-70 family)